jgi:hypothetical protein
MIISASRRTDIPSYYSEWFCNRVKEGFVLARNPMNFHRISRISLAPEAVDGIVFWTKNPVPMLGKLGALREHMYYFQFTVTPYGKDIEPCLPSKRGVILPAFRELSGMLGADRVIWRYDPILINAKYTAEYHLRAFGEIAGELCGFTKKVTVSFIDADYRAVRSRGKELALTGFPPEAQIELLSRLADIACGRGLALDICAAQTDLSRYGVGRARCIDGELLSKLLGRRLDIGKAKAQRPGCGCAESVDVGAYNTCRNGCLYCYANYNRNAVAGNAAGHDPLSPLISGKAGENDKISERK